MHLNLINVEICFIRDGSSSYFTLSIKTKRERERKHARTHACRRRLVPAQQCYRRWQRAKAQCSAARTWAGHCTGCWLGLGEPELASLSRCPSQFLWWHAAEQSRGRELQQRVLVSLLGGTWLVSSRLFSRSPRARPCRCHEVPHKSLRFFFLFSIILLKSVA